MSVEEENVVLPVEAGKKVKKDKSKKKDKKKSKAVEGGEAIESPENGAVEPEKKKKDKKEKKKAKAAAENGEAAEPVEDGAVESEKKKSKKEKKEKKRKAAEEAAQNGEAPVAPEEPAEDAANGDAQAPAEEASERKKEKKEKKKKDKKDKKRKAGDAEDTEMVDAAPQPKDKKRKNRDDDAAPPKPKKTKSESNGTGSTTYTQSSALTSLPQSEIDEFLASKFVTITDETTTAPLRPILSFSHLPKTPLLDKKPFAGFPAPTPIQSASWPFTLSGRDVIGVAETGSGKTMAFALPCVEALYNTGGKKKGIRAVMVCPTRELAMQTHEQVTKLSSLVGLSCVCVYGGAPKPQQRETLRGADIVVATPGRLKDFISEGSCDLSRAQFVVLDEADRMLDTGFEEDIKEILRSCPPNGTRQTLMFTATWPTSVQALASSMMTTPAKVTISSGGANPDGDLRANQRISQTVEVVDPRAKEQRLLQLLQQRQRGAQKNDRILVFALYKKEATRVEEFLQRRGIRVAGIHGDLKQEQRTRSLEAFKSGNVSVLVATDVAARGLDIPEVKLVINLTVSFLCLPLFRPIALY